MNSTEKQDQRDQKRAEKYFEREIFPAAEAIGNPDRWFAPGAEEQADSYWEVPIEEKGFSVESLPLEDLEGALAALWRDEATLERLARTLPDLARKIKRDDALEEMSPFVYAMF